MTLPQNTQLPISALAGIFSNTTATYKFYWFVAMMDIIVKERKTRISFWEIIIENQRRSKSAIPWQQQY
ncbi:MAG: hypothetical protein ACI358_02295 [Candidatus Limimorpha sp.]